jgi:ABC-type sugar transport system permease subunit
MMRLRAERRRDLAGWLLCVPALAIFGTFFLAPALCGFYISFHRWDGSSPEMSFVGWANYASLLSDPEFWDACEVTLTVLAAMLLIKLPLALVLAAGLARSPRGQSLYRLAFFLPHVLSTTMVAVIWVFLLDPYQGLVNYALRGVGLDAWQQGWLGQGSTAMPSLIVAAIWWTFGFYVVLFGAAIARIPQDYYDALKLETNSRLHGLIFVTIPMLREQIFVACVMTTGGVLGVMTGFFMLLTGGGPAGRTTTLGLYGYATAFRGLEFGRASAISAIALFAVFAAILVPTLRLARRRLEF